MSDQEVTRLTRRLKRETSARLEAEAIAERGLRELYERQREIELLETIATAANEAQATESALAFAAQKICEYTHWPIGHVFQVSESGSQTILRSSAWHIADNDRYAEFRRVTLAMSFTRGVGLPGRVWETGIPAWVDDISKDENFPRLAHAFRSGLNSAFAFPVMIESEVVAVLEFFAPEVLPPNSAQLRIMSQVGTQLGRVVERHRAKERLIHDALHDALTRLPNRALFVDRLRNLMQRVRRQPHYCFAVMFLDLDRFKTVNDSLGHMAGDELIVEVARRLVKSLRTTDSISRRDEEDMAIDDAIIEDEHLVARLGGDEFTIIAEDIHDINDATRIAERIQTVLSEPFVVSGQKVFTTASIGITLGSPAYASVEDLLRHADIAMYRAKAQGRSRWVVFDEAMHEQAVKILQLEVELRQALAKNEFFLAYQPIVSLPDGRIRGLEALIRWRHPTRGLVSPMDFIPLAEEIGLIRPIGTWVLETACRQARLWQQAFPSDPPLSMSVNLSAGQLGQASLLESVAGLVQSSGIAPGSLKLELTESMVMSDAEQTCELLFGFKKLGIQLSLDDFGTGYSSLSYLRRLPMDALKIDRSFVRQMDEDPEKREIAKIIISLARALGLKVIAEGAETEAEVRMLADLGCDFAQGFHFYRPLDTQAAEAALQAQRQHHGALAK